MDAIQLIAKETSKSQKYAFDGASSATKDAFKFSNDSQKSSTTSEEKRDSYRNAENMHRESMGHTERMNANNNSTWKSAIKGVVAVTLVLGAVTAYAVKVRSSIK